MALEFNESRQICRIVIFCQHPETLFYASDSCDTGRLIDQGMNLAAALTDYTVRPEYYADFFDNIRRGQRGHFDSPGFPVDMQGRMHPGEWRQESNRHPVKRPLHWFVEQMS